MTSPRIARTRAPYVVMGAIAVTVIGRVASVWDRLPARMASHYGASGKPDAWMSRTGYFTMMAIVVGGVVLLLASVPLWVRRLPAEYVNLPHRHYWLAPERRDASLARLGGWSAWFCALTMALVAAMNELSLRANLANAPLPTATAFALLGAYVAGVVVLLIVLYRSFPAPPAQGQ